MIYAVKKMRPCKCCRHSLLRMGIRLLGTLAALCILGISTAWAATDSQCTAAAAETTTPLVIATWGGSYEAAQRAALFKPFTARTGDSRDHPVPEWRPAGVAD
ncbi:MAG: hypothetical protein R3E95_16180 [Thiolinea sp.]